MRDVRLFSRRRLKLISAALAVLLNLTAQPALASANFSEYPVPTPGSEPTLITFGPDGNLWFTENGGNKIGKITTSGVITEYAVPTLDSFPTGITTGPDGNLWFTEFSGNKIGKITTSGTITEYALPNGGAPRDIASGRNADLFFTEEQGNRIGRITTAGAFTEYPVPPPASDLFGIAAGPDHQQWFTGRFANQIGVLRGVR